MTEPASHGWDGLAGGATLLAAVMLLVVAPLVAVAVIARGPAQTPRTPLQVALDDRLPVVGARGGTSYVIRSVEVRTHSASRWYLDVDGTGRAKGAGYEGTVNGLVPGAPCEPGGKVEVVGTHAFAPRAGDEGYGTADAGAVADGMAQAAVRLVGEACAAVPANGPD